MKLYVVAYDISANQRRQKMADYLEAYGQRINLSVFECWFTPAQLRETTKFIRQTIRERTDTVKIYYLSRECYARSMHFGKKPGHTPRTYFSE